MDIFNTLKSSKVLSVLSKMNIFIASFVLLMVFLICGGVMGRSQSQAPVAPEERNRELRLVHVVMRHSIRAPVSLYPTDPYQHHLFEPNGRGQLTMKGLSGAYEIGKYLRNRYDAFLGAHVNYTQFYAESTGVDRAQATVMTVNAALWQPKSEQRFEANDYFPVPVATTKLDDDMLLLVAKDCPQYNLERTRVEQSADVQAKLAPYKDMMAEIEAESGQSMRTFDDIGDIYATLLAEQQYGLELPAWTEAHWARMADAAGYSFVVKAFNAKMQRLKGGVLLRKLIGDWEARVGNRAATKMFLYGGHDSTIANLLSALQVFTPQVPNYGMAIMFELSFDRQLQKYGLEIFTRNSSLPPSQMQLPGCDKFCLLEDVVRLTHNVIPQDWDAECATDDAEYTPPPFEGP